MLSDRGSFWGCCAVFLLVTEKKHHATQAAAAAAALVVVVVVVTPGVVLVVVAATSISFVSLHQDFRKAGGRRQGLRERTRPSYLLLLRFSDSIQAAKLCLFCGVCGGFVVGGNASGH